MRRLLQSATVQRYLPSLRINYVAMNKIYRKKFTTAVLYKDENLLWFVFYFDISFNGNVMRPLGLLFVYVFLGTTSFLFRKSVKGAFTSLRCLDYGKV